MGIMQGSASGRIKKFLYFFVAFRMTGVIIFEILDLRARGDACQNVCLRWVCYGIHCEEEDGFLKGGGGRRP